MYLSNNQVNKSPVYIPQYQKVLLESRRQQLKPSIGEDIFRYISITHDANSVDKLIWLPSFKTGILLSYVNRPLTL